MTYKVRKARPDELTPKGKPWKVEAQNVQFEFVGARWFTTFDEATAYVVRRIARQRRTRVER